MELQPSSAQAASVRRKKTQRELFALTLLDSGGAARTQPNRDPGRKQQLVVLVVVVLFRSLAHPLHQRGEAGVAVTENLAHFLGLQCPWTARTFHKELAGLDLSLEVRFETVLAKVGRMARATLRGAVASDPIFAIAERRHRDTLEVRRARLALGQVRPQRRQAGALLASPFDSVKQATLRREIDEPQFRVVGARPVTARALLHEQDMTATIRLVAEHLCAP